MKIAVCEDERAQAEQIAEYVKRHPQVAQHRVYFSADNLLADYEAGERFDLVFMDIQMEGRNGFEAAKIIHKQYSDDAPLIVFVTHTAEYALYGYGVAFRYLKKPTDYDIVRKCIDLALAELQPKNIVFETTSGTACINSKKIIYLESYLRKVTICTTERTYESKMTLSAISELLNCGFIVQVHKSYYVNLAHVARYESKNKEIELSNGKKITVSKKKKQEFIESFKSFHRGEV